jgi:phosphatidate phosphatase APP1
MKPLKPVFKFIRKPFKRFKVFLKQKAGWLGIPRIVPYRGYGSTDEIQLQGMVIEDKGLSKPMDREKTWQNILATLKRFSSDEIPGVKIRAEFLGLSAETETDENGFFTFRFDVKKIKDTILADHWHPVDYELLDQVVEDQPQTRARGEVRIVSPEESRIIVSDIDDTVLVSHSTQTLRKLRLMLFKNALTRTPFPGVANFYNALEMGPEKRSFYPFFYVSSSEWNLYDLLEDFFTHNDIPKGVFLLKKLEHSIYKFWKSGGGNHEHKYEKIKTLLKLFLHQKFILVGDSGQRDPLIYRRLADEFPGRIEAIYIRKVGSKVHFENIQKLHAQLQELQTEYLQVEHTRDAATHALEKGFIHKDLMEKMKEKAMDN